MMRQTSADIKRALGAFLLAALCICGALLFAPDIYAQTSWDVVPQEARAVEGETFCPDRKDGMVGRVVYCMQNIIITAAKQFLEAFVGFLKPIIVSLLVLAVVLYGVLMAMGVVYLTRDTMMLIFKLGGVLLFTGILSGAPVFGGMIDNVFGAMEGLMQIVSSYVVTGSSIAYCSDQSQMPNVFDIPRGTAHTAWDNIDCMFISLLGLGPNAVTAVAGAGAAAHPVAAGLIVLLAGLFFLGGIGILILVLGMFFLLTLLVSIVRAVKLYLSAVIAVAFLLCVSPLLIPLVLFRATQPIFNKWLNELVGHMLIPIFLMMYLTMIVAAIDAIIFKGPSSLYWAIGREASQTEGFNMRTWLETGADGNGHAETGVPGTAALGLMNQIRLCNDPVQKEQLGEICDDIGALNEMLNCAIDPWLPTSADNGDDEGSAPEADLSSGSCADLPAKFDNKGGPYYGFMMNAEVLAFAVTPSRPTDEEKRQEDDGCGNPISCVGNAIGSVVGAVVEGAKWVVGQVTGLLGGLLQGLGDAVKFIASVVSYPCRFVPGAAGDVCSNVTGGTINFLGDVVHASGSIANFGSRVLLDGIMAALGFDRFDGFFDAKVIDLAKVAAYQCKMDSMRSGGGTISPTDAVAWLDNCPGVGNLLTQLIYVVLTALVVVFLMFKWLPYVTVLAHAITSAIARSDVPGEEKLSGLLQKGVMKMTAAKINK